MNDKSKVQVQKQQNQNMNKSAIYNIQPNSMNHILINISLFFLIFLFKLSYYIVIKIGVKRPLSQEDKNLICFNNKKTKTKEDIKTPIAIKFKKHHIENENIERRLNFNSDCNIDNPNKANASSRNVSRKNSQNSKMSNNSTSMNNNKKLNIHSTKESRKEKHNISDLINNKKLKNKKKDTSLNKVDQISLIEANLKNEISNKKVLLAQNLFIYSNKKLITHELKNHIAKYKEAISRLNKLKHITEEKNKAKIEVSSNKVSEFNAVLEKFRNDKMTLLEEKLLIEKNKENLKNLISDGLQNKNKARIDTEVILERIKKLKEKSSFLEKDLSNINSLVEGVLKIKKENDCKRVHTLEQNFVIRPFSKTFLIIKNEYRGSIEERNQIKSNSIIYDSRNDSINDYSNNEILEEDIHSINDITNNEDIFCCEKIREVSVVKNRKLMIVKLKENINKSDIIETEIEESSLNNNILYLKSNHIISLVNNNLIEPCHSKSDEFSFKIKEVHMIINSYLKKIINSVNENNQTISNLGYNCFFFDIVSCQTGINTVCGKDYLLSVINDVFKSIKNQIFSININEIIYSLDNNDKDNTSKCFYMKSIFKGMTIANEVFKINNKTFDNFKNSIGYVIKLKSSITTNYLNLVYLNVSSSKDIDYNTNNTINTSSNINFDYYYLLKLLKDSSFVLPKNKIKINSNITNKSPNKINTQTTINEYLTSNVKRSVSKSKDFNNKESKNNNKERNPNISVMKIKISSIREEEERNDKEEFIYELLKEIDYSETKYNNIFVNSEIEELIVNNKLQALFS